MSADNGRLLYVPEGCAHGCQSMEDNTEFHYMTSAYYSPGEAQGIRYDDEAIAIRWPLAVSSVSEQDANWPLLQRN